MERMREIDEQIRGRAEEEEWNVSDSCKEQVERILEGLPEISVKSEQKGSLCARRIFLLAAVLAAAVGTTVVASELFQWNEKAVEQFDYPTEEEQNTMTMNGIAKEQNSSATDAGITITAEQTVQDSGCLYILLDIRADEAIIDGNSGFDNPDENVDYGEPWILTEEEDIFTNVSMGFSPDTPVFSELSDHGYYEIYALKSQEKELQEDSVTIKFTEYNYYTYENGDTIPHKIRGEWTLTLPLGADTMDEPQVYEPNKPIDVAGMTVNVKRVELSSLSLNLVFDMDDMKRLEEKLYAGQTDTFIYETQFAGFLDKEGNEIPCGWNGMSGKYDYEKREVIYQMGLSSFVDVKQVSTVLLGDKKVSVPLEDPEKAAD